MGKVCLLENVACVKFWDSVLHAVVFWEGATMIAAKLFLQGLADPILSFSKGTGCLLKLGVCNQNLIPRYYLMQLCKIVSCHLIPPPPTSSSGASVTKQFSGQLISNHHYYGNFNQIIYNGYRTEWIQHNNNYYSETLGK